MNTSINTKRISFYLKTANKPDLVNICLFLYGQKFKSNTVRRTKINHFINNYPTNKLIQQCEIFQKKVFAKKKRKKFTITQIRIPTTKREYIPIKDFLALEHSFECYPSENFIMSCKSINYQVNISCFTIFQNILTYYKPKNELEAINLIRTINLIKKKIDSTFETKNAVLVVLAGIMGNNPNALLSVVFNIVAIEPAVKRRVLSLIGFNLKKVNAHYLQLLSPKSVVQNLKPKELVQLLSYNFFIYRLIKYWYLIEPD